VLAQIAPQGSKAYHVSPLLSLHGNPDKDALQSALTTLMERHESLRSVIDGDYQKILSVEELPDKGLLNSTDLSTSNDPAASEKKWLADYAAKGFDLEKGPLFEVNLLKIAADEWRLVFKGHHIIVDGLSMNIVINELAVIYNATLKGTSPALSPTLHWHGYAEWRNSSSLQEQISFQKQETYWLQQLEGELPLLALPVDHIEPAIKSYRGGRCTCMIPSQISDALSALGRVRGCTDFMVLFAAYALWLHRLSGQDDILTGVPVAGRSLTGGDKVVGYCTHLLPIRSRIIWEQTFSEYLKTFRSVLLHGYQHQDYPFAELMEKLNLQRDGQTMRRDGQALQRDGQALQRNAKLYGGMGKAHPWYQLVSILTARESLLQWMAFPWNGSPSPYIIQPLISH